MSSYLAKTKHPKTGKWETAAWLDDHFGRHKYGVKFLDGQIFNTDFYDLPTKDDNVDTDWGLFFPQEGDHLPEASTTNHGSGGSEAPLPTWTKAVEAALRASSYSMMTPIGREAALASIQAATADLVRATNIRQIENWRNWIKGDSDLADLVEDMDDAIAALKDEPLTDENGVWREVDLRAEGGGDATIR